MIYLASPYSHPDPFEREHRYVTVLKVLTEQFLAKRIWAYSPIVHCHELAKVSTLPKDMEFWSDYNHHMLSLCEELVVVRMDGWESSRGVKAEILWAEGMNIPVRYL